MINDSSLHSIVVYHPADTKVSPPHLPATVHNRPRLNQLIAHSTAPLVVIAAPAGYGKSTVTLQAFHAESRPIAWVSIDAYDHDFAEFFRLLVRSLQHSGNSPCLETQRLFAETVRPSHAAIVHAFRADVRAAHDSFVLVIDDYHLINNTAIDDALAVLIPQIASTMRVVICSRTNIPPSLARLRHQISVTDITEADLRFTDSEAWELLQSGDLAALSQSDAAAINDRAEGWGVGLQLASHYLRGRSTAEASRIARNLPESIRSIETYLWEEVIARQAEPVREFLLATSILDLFDGSLCEALTGNAASSAIIRTLDDQRLFMVGLDEQGQWYRYHYLFRDALRDQLALTASRDTIRTLHARAAEWLEQHGAINEALRHALAAEDWTRTERLLERVSTDHYEQDRLAALCEVLQDVPTAVLERSPILALRLAWARIRTGEFELAERPLQIARDAIYEANDRSSLISLLILEAYHDLHENATNVIDLCNAALGLLGDDQPLEQAAALTIRGWAFMYTGESARALDSFASVRQKNGYAPGTWTRLSEIAGSASVFVQRGMLEEAIALLQSALPLDDRYASVLLANIYLERNQLEEADHCLQTAIGDFGDQSPLSLQSRIWLGMSRLAWARGDRTGALQHIEAAVGFALQMKSIRFLRQVLAQQARFWIACDQTMLAARWSEGGRLDLVSPQDHERQFELLTYVRLLLHQGEINHSLDLLQQIDDLAERQERYGDLVEIRMLRAIALTRTGDQKAALAMFLTALDHGASGGYVRVFAKFTDEIRPLVRRAARFAGHGDYARRLLIALDADSASWDTAHDRQSQMLSSREIEVLRLADAGLSNNAIAQHLFISQATVKRHLSTIYKKMLVTSRTSAIASARHQGIL